MLSEKSWRLDAVIRLLFAILTGVFAALLVETILQEYVFKQKPDDTAFWPSVFGMLSLDGVILICVSFFLRRAGLRWSEAFGFTSPGLRRAICWGILACFLFLPVGLCLRGLSEWLLRSLHYKTEAQQAVQALQQAPTLWARILFAVCAIVLAPLAEESLFRGILYPTIRKYGGFRMAILTTSITFGIIHLNLPSLIPLTLFGVVLALLYEKTNNLLACLIAHGLFNGINVVLMFTVYS